jgi:hypothetical protein
MSKMTIRIGDELFEPVRAVWDYCDICGSKSPCYPFVCYSKKPLKIVLLCPNCREADE